MFSFFRAAEKVGSELIHDAIGQFESIAQRIEAGVRHNRESITVNNDKISSLQAENGVLDEHAARGESVAAKLRALIS